MYNENRHIDANNNVQAYSYILFEVALSDIHMYSGHYIICRKPAFCTAHAHYTVVKFSC